MFTGIVETKTAVLERQSGGLTLARPANWNDLEIGMSIAVSGVCLTVVAFDAASLRFDVVGETWAKTKLGTLHPGDFVNLERSLSANGRFEGHIVQGHIEGVGETLSLEADGLWTTLKIAIPASLLPCIVPKGSIAVDGVSLTVAAIDQHICSIALIPHTLSITTLGQLKPGDPVNIETDVMMRGLKGMMERGGLRR